MQTDPIGYGDGMNWYNYVHGDPVNGRDPGGTCPEIGETDDSGNCHYGSGGLEASGMDSLESWSTWGYDGQTYGGITSQSQSDIAYANAINIFESYGNSPASEAKVSDNGPPGKQVYREFLSTKGEFPISKYAFMNDPVVQAALKKAWSDSNPYGDESQKNEQGGWIVEYGDGTYAAPRSNNPYHGAGFDAGLRPSCDGQSCTVLAWYHTHPFSDSEGYYPYDWDQPDYNATHDLYKVTGVVVTFGQIFYYKYH